MSQEKQGKPVLGRSGKDEAGNAVVTVADVTKWTDDSNRYLDTLEADNEQTKEIVKALQVTTRDIEEMVKGVLSQAPGNTPVNDILAGLGLRLEVPDEDEFKHVNRTYYNLVVNTPEELLGLAQMDRRISGLSENLQNGLLRISDSQGIALTDLRRYQQLNDEGLLVVKILSAKRNGTYHEMPYQRRVESWRNYPEFKALGDKITRALHTGSGGGADNLLPTLMSSQMIDMIEADLIVDARFPSITMAGPTFTWPVLTSHIDFKHVGESTGDEFQEDTDLYDTPTTTQVTLTAKKFLALTVLSSEATEDTIIASLPFIQGEMVRSAAHAIEDTDINGEENAATMDGTTFNPAKSNRRAWNGLRYFALITASYPADAAIDNGATAADLPDDAITVQAAMGEFGVRPDEFVWIVGNKAYHELRKNDEYRSNAALGLNSPIFKGSVGEFEGSPVIRSTKLQNMQADGMYGDGTGLTFGSMLGVHTPSFIRGIRREIEVETSIHARFNQDQIVVRGRLRRAFNALRTPSATQAPVGLIHGI